MSAREVTAMRADGELVVRHLARRGDDVEAWLKRKRDELPVMRARSPAEWSAAWEIDQLLDDYRLHADTGTPLDAEVRER